MHTLYLWKHLQKTLILSNPTRTHGQYQNTIVFSLYLILFSSSPSNFASLFSKALFAQTARHRCTHCKRKQSHNRISCSISNCFHSFYQLWFSLYQLPFPSLMMELLSIMNDCKVVSWGTITKRHVLEATNAELVQSPSLILAPKRTHRRDPLDGFNYYRGGWNISEEHYFFSVGFTAAPLFIMAAIWFLGFVLCFFSIFLCHCCFQNHDYGYSRVAYWVSLVFIQLFTIDAVTGCLALYIGQGNFNRVTRGTLDFVEKQADFIVENLRDVSENLEAAKHVAVGWTFFPPNILKEIDRVEKKVNASANNLEHETEDNSNNIQEVIDSVRVILIVLAAIMLLLAFFGSVFSVFGMKCLVYALVIIGWILVTVTFILSGIFLVLHNVAADTCVAMDEWVQNPVAHTAFDDILPCVDNSTAQETLNKTKETTFQLVGIVNQFINNVANLNNVPPNAGPIYYNQSGPWVPVLCNPFHPNNTHRNCAHGEVEFTNSTEEWRKYVCQVSATNICITVGRLTPVYYDQLISTVNGLNTIAEGLLCGWLWLLLH
nr:uncharacterized protein LOC112490910 isoform X2 [Ziziphus jujuba var. spinosa]